MSREQFWFFHPFRVRYSEIDGTAITVAAIAVTAVFAKDLARRLSGASEGGGALIMRGIEFGAAGLVLLLGLGLLLGYLAAERVTCL